MNIMVCPHSLQSNRELLARLLRRRNVSRVDVLEGGMECIAHATAMTQAQLHSVQVWLLDKEMPEMVRACVLESQVPYPIRSWLV